MPVGFENSALKMSFSLSSLQSGGGQGSPQQVLQVERPYNSLTKKSRVNSEWRRSWNTPEEKKDDFWAALQPNYAFLMDNNLIESCKEAHVELSCDEEETTLLSKWSFKDFTGKFSELCSWLNGIQKAVYDKEENIRDRGLRLVQIEEMQRNVSERKHFIDQAKHLLMEHSELQDEVSWRVNYLTRKWDMLEQSISPSKCQSQKSSCIDFKHEAMCLKEWIREMECRLKPLDMHVANKWNNQELAEKITECEVLHQDIKAHGKVVAAVKNRTELSEVPASKRLAERLERRYHQLFLRLLEWQFYLEKLLQIFKHPHPDRLCSESDEEPRSKHPRLSSADCSDHLTDDSYFEDDIQDYCVEDANIPTSAKCCSLPRSCSSICEHSKYVDINVGSDHVSNQELEKKNSRIQESAEKMSCEEASAEFSICDTTISMETTSSPVNNELNSFNQSDRKAHNLATYYFKHHETDSDQMQFRENIEGEIASLNNKIGEVKMCEESSDEEWIYTSAEKTMEAKEKRNFLASGNSYQTLRKRNVAMRLNFDENVENSSENKVDDKTLCHSSTGNDKRDEMDSWNDKMRLPRSTEDTKECIQCLVHQAELLVRQDSLMASAETLDPSLCDSKITNSQLRDIKQWVRMQSDLQGKVKVPDSYDASGEYTSGDSDGECSTESGEESVGISLVNKHLDALLSSCPRLDSAEGFSDPNVTLKADNSPDFTDSRESSKVVTRSRQRCKRERPWSVSGVSQLSGLRKRDDESSFANFSASESALHQIIANSSLIRDRKNSMVSSNGYQDNLSSSTVNEYSKIASEHSGSLQRRRARQRKKTPQSTSVKDDVTSDVANQLVCTSSSSTPKLKNVDKRNPKNIQTPPEDKERRFSETTCISATSEQNTISDSSTFPTESSSKVNAEDRTNSSEDELISQNNVGCLVFRLGPKEGAVTPKADLTSHSLPQSGVDSDVERTSGTQGPDEQFSSSDPAWDNYQEKYMSEPYSEEIADSETARRLLEFGDDYHKFLDSQSDCASSIEINQKTSPQRKRKSIVGAGDSSVLDSDSDLEDIQQVIRQSQLHFVLSEQVLNKQLNKTNNEVLVDYADIIAACKENKRCLRVILENVKEGEILTLTERREIKELLEKWNDLQIYADELQKMNALQQKLIMLRKKLLDTTSKVSSLTENLNDLSHLESAIEMLKEETTSLLDFKEQLVHLNVAVDQLATDPVSQGNTISFVMPHLKDEMTDLYRIWSNSFKSVTSQLEQFERAAQTWHKFDKELSDLQTSLQGDHSTLLNLGKSLDDGGTAVEDVAVSIRNIARKLSELPGSSRNINSSSSCQDVQETSIGTREGSLSDSGISDSGSENELNQRARRLAFLRQLAQHLQTELGTSDGLVAQINEQIEHLDRELHQLQDVCRRLIARTTFWAGMPQPLLDTTSESNMTGNIQSRATKLDASGKGTTECSKPHRRRSAQSVPVPWNKGKNEKASKQEKRIPWIWRVARAAFPVQLTLATMICVACFLEPHCCESVNNLSLSLSPQLRYLYGPPPV